ncbi:RNA polymerase sigma-70 factor, ECF subfamily [Sinosporangium album]|uniref:RNA polymerase sigma-70 factor, ECF subfamily n=1 Tax=Sinosporangium album TaxID=504805 RepID=A0A1G8LT03_9ACTN|nr:sigma-70 family RNA polymerase sigma factor [Sinosporangium album]SDI58330.1 RNA polymerase sigma-70 factor, ECF subfamily [Sinosporangium album]
MDDDPTNQFTALYDRHYRSVLGYVLLRAEQAAAEDVVSETFLIAWRRFHDLPDRPLPWLLGTARNLLRKHHHSRAHDVVLMDRIATLSVVGPPVDSVAEAVQARETALSALAQMSERDIEALVLTVWHGLSPAEAAKVTGGSRAAFAVRLHRARKRLATSLQETSTKPASSRYAPLTP